LSLSPFAICQASGRDRRGDAAAARRVDLLYDLNSCLY